MARDVFNEKNLAANLRAYDGSAWQKVINDPSTHDLIVINQSHHEIHEGDHYLINDSVDLALDAVYDLQFTTPNTTTWCHMTFTLIVESETEWYVYENVTISTPGTAITPINSNRNSTNTSGVVAKYITNTSVANANADTATASATEIAHGLIPAGQRNSGSEVREQEIILKQGEDYCMRAIANTAGIVSFNMQWYEHADAS